MTLLGPEATHRWQGRTLVDRDGEPVGSIEIIYSDKASGQPEWALLAAGAAGPAPTFVPLGRRKRGRRHRPGAFAKTLVERAPSVPAGRELPEDQEEGLYRHYGVPIPGPSRRAVYPPANPSLPAGRLRPGPDLPVGEPTMTAGEPVAASGPPPGVGARLPRPLSSAMRWWPGDRSGSPTRESSVPQLAPHSRSRPGLGAGADRSADQHSGQRA
jgi:hypothetical protein